MTAGCAKFTFEEGARRCAYYPGFAEQMQLPLGGKIAGTLLNPPDTAPLGTLRGGGAYVGAYVGAGGGLPGAGSGLPLQAEATLWGGVALGRSGIGTSVGPPSYTAGVWPSPPGFATMRHRPPPPPPPKIDESAQTQGVMMCAPRQASPELRPSEPTPHPPNRTPLF